MIRNPQGGEDAYLSSWWLGMGRAVGTYLLIFALAPWIANFYGHADLTALLRVALLSTIFSGAISPRSILPQREMNFARWAAITNGGGICGVILTVVLSLLVRDVWALAIGYCGENAFRCLLSYALCPGSPSLNWDWRAAQELLTFSRGVFGLAFLNLIIGRADVFVLARLTSSTDLGLYTMAVALVLTPSSFLTGVIAQTLLPALCRVQKDMERLNRILEEVTSWLILLGLPAVVSICLCAPSLLKVTYGARYTASTGPLSLASAVVFLTALNALITGVMFAVGRPALHRLAVAISAATTLIVIYPACRSLGTVGGQVAALLAITAGYLYQLTQIRELTALNLRRYCKAFVAPAFASAGILGIVLGSRRLGLTTRPAVDIALCVGGCAVAYTICASLHLRNSRKQVTLHSVQTPESAAAL